MIGNNNYFLAIITIFAFYQLVFFYLIRPYYAEKIVLNAEEKVEIPEVAFEVVYLMILVLGFAVAPIVQISHYLLWGIILIIYGLATKRSSRSFFLASALVFKMHRELDIEHQLKFQENIIFSVCIISGIVFLTVGYYF